MKLFCVLCILCCICSRCTGLVWGGWARVPNPDQAFSGSLNDLFREIVTSFNATVHRQPPTKLTLAYLTQISVFFTGSINDAVSILTPSEQEVLVEWVRFHGGILLVVGGFSGQFTSSRSFVEPFGIGVRGGDDTGKSWSTCDTEQHEIVDGVSRIRHRYGHYFDLGDTEALPLCSKASNKVTDALLRYGFGYVLFSSLYVFYGDSVDTYVENRQYAENVVRWIETLQCSTLDDGNLCTVSPVPGSCGIFSDLNCDDGDFCTLETCDPSVGCVQENPEECYPTMHSKLDGLEDRMQTLEDSLVNPTPTSLPTTIPTHHQHQDATPSPTVPPVKPLLIPTHPPSQNPTVLLTSNPTGVPVGDIVQMIVDSGVADIQNTLGDMQDILTDVLKSQSNLENRIRRVEDILLELHPTPLRTSLPTANPSYVPTNYPTAHCMAESGKWVAGQNPSSLTTAESSLGCCVACEGFSRCSKWHYFDGICVLFESDAARDDSTQESIWIRGEIATVTV